MRVKEYRIVMPMTTDEFQIGQRFSVAEASKQQTGGGEGVEVLANEPFRNIRLFNGDFTEGQYTHKIYHLNSILSGVPAFVKKVLPKGAMIIHEHSWNAYPYSKTELTNPGMKKDNFYIRIETIHLNKDRGNTENAHRLSEELLNELEVVNINVANDDKHLKSTDISEETSPSKFYSKKTRRGPLRLHWRKNCQPVMCAYKLVTVNFQYFGLQCLTESHIHKQYARIFCKFHREVFCWIDRWYGLTMNQIRAIEEQAQLELDEARNFGNRRGMAA